MADDNDPGAAAPGNGEPGPGATGAGEGDGQGTAQVWTCDVPGCPSPGPFATAGGLRRHRTRQHGPAVSPGEGRGDAGGTEPPVGPSPGEAAGEQRPGAPRRRGIRDVLRRKVDDGRQDHRAKRASRRVWSGPREPLDEGFAWAYGGIGTMVVRSGGDYTPVGRVMEMQSGSIGRMFDEAMQGTLADRLVQPLVRQGKQFKALGEAAALPIMTAMIVKQPAWLGLRFARDEFGNEGYIADGPLYQPYYSVWEANALEMAKGFQRTEVRRREVREELKDVPFLAPIIEAGGDPILFMMVQVLGAPMPAEEGARGNGPAGAIVPAAP
jgi:hypothetical protein